MYGAIRGCAWVLWEIQVVLVCGDHVVVCRWGQGSHKYGGLGMCVVVCVFIRLEYLRCIVADVAGPGW